MPMGLMDHFETAKLPQRWHEETRHWADTYFPEMAEVQDERVWKRFYPDLPVTNVAVIQAKPDAFAQFARNAVGADATTLDLSGRVWRAEELNDAQFAVAAKIIRAQASTELGSIQQHRMVYERIDEGSTTGLDRKIVEAIHNADGDGRKLEAISFSSKRVCVEELRHHYQMGGVLTLDPTWDRPRFGRRWATEIMEELLAMRPGEHVLDAFNIEFQSLLDTATFMALIDRVGKYQLEMQHQFRYAPMALSMPYMRFMEESYHLAAGEKLLEAIATAAVANGGNYGIDEVQMTINMWYPRGLEMFGSELGGTTTKGLFKTLTNAEAQRLFIAEVDGKVRNLNLAVVQAKTGADREEAGRVLRRIEERGERVGGLGPEDLVRAPHRRFFRTRGLAEFGDYRLPGSMFSGVGYAYLPFDVRGKLLTDGGKPIPREDYVEYLKTVLPKRYMDSRHWRFVQDEFLFNPKWGEPEPVGDEG